jgi:two-component system OmpR family response regulator
VQRILIVDDDPHIREVVRFALEKEGFHTVEAADGRQALERFATTSVDLVVLDVMMPEMDGTEVCRRLRATSTVPIVFLSSRDEEIDSIVGLELGGDDYVTKPFSPRELVARVRAVLRRVGNGRTVEVKGTAKVLKVGKLQLDEACFQAQWGEHPVVLTVTEFGLLRTLMGFPGKVYTRTELMDGAYRDETTVSDRTIDSHLRRLRQKLAAVGADPIETVHGVGYKLVVR